MITQPGMPCTDRTAMLAPSPHARVISFKTTPEQPELPVSSIRPHRSNARCTSETLPISPSTAPAVTSEIISAQHGAWHLPRSNKYSEAWGDFFGCSHPIVGDGRLDFVRAKHRPGHQLFSAIENV